MLVDLIPRPDLLTPNGRRWVWLGTRPHITLAGREVLLATWTTPCARCGAPVLATVPADATHSNSFEVLHCVAHRLTARQALAWARVVRRPSAERCLTMLEDLDG